MISKRAFLGLLLVSWFPFFVRAVQFYAASNLTNIPQASLLAPSADTFRQFLEQQQTFVFFVTVYVGAGLIANDRRANALQIYLSKPLTRAEYVLGKLAILMTFLALVTWLPAIVLLIVQIAFAGNFTFFQNNVFLFPAITAVRVHRGRARLVDDAGAVVAVEEQPLRRDSLRGGDLLHPGGLRRALRGDAQHRVLVAVVLGQPRRRSAT